MLTRLIGLALAAGSLVACDLGVRDLGADSDVPPPNVDLQLGCTNGCHGDEASNAPPRDTTGQTDTALRTVGAHRNHLDPAPTWHRAVACADCHSVPQEVDDPGHIDTPAPAELAFGGIARNGGVEPVWTGETCQNTYCHGATLAGGALVEPVWTELSGNAPQDTCGSCHGLPPPAPHPEDMNCGGCHPTIQPGTFTFLDPASHIDGKVDLAANGDLACDSCHGGGGVSAPPTDLAGNTSRTSPGVGAHRVHLGQSAQYREITCSQCHTVPVEVGARGHIDGDNVAEVVFDSMNAGGTYTKADSGCQNLYCHGNGRSSLGVATWTSQQAMACNSCHDDGRLRGQGMSGDHDEHIKEGIRCAECHSTVVNNQLAIIGPQLHVNGVHEVVIRTGGTFNPAADSRRCSNLACHGSERW